MWVETVPAYNNLKPFHTKGSKWVGYIVKMDGVKYYIAGDTDVNEDVKKVKCDVVKATDFCPIPDGIACP